MVKNCCVPQCRYVVTKGKKRNFHLFPNCMALKNQWIQILKMVKEPSKHMLVCSDHFKTTDYIITNSGDRSPLLKKGVVPSQNLPKTSLDLELKSLKFKTAKDQSLRMINQLETSDNVKKASSLHELKPRINGCIVNIADTPIQSKNGCKLTMTSSNGKLNHIKTMFVSKRMGYASINDEDLEYATGLERHSFELIFSYLQKYYPIANIQHLSHKDALLITLFKLRHNLDYKMIEFKFQIECTYIAKIFQEVVKNLYNALKRIGLWELSHKNLKMYRTIIYCTEFLVMSSDVPCFDQLTHSTCKNCLTFKLLVGCDETGCVNFISDVLVGTATHRETFVQSGLLDKLEEGDTILGDRSFNIHDLLREKGISLNIPVLLKGRSQLKECEAMKTKIFAKRLIENVECRAKKNIILVNPLPTYLWPLAGKISYVCYALVNFYNPLK